MNKKLYLLVFILLIMAPLASAEYSYYVNTDNDTLWVNFTSLPVGNTTFNIEKTAGYVSNGSATFTYYEDFEDGTAGDTSHPGWTWTGTSLQAYGPTGLSMYHSPFLTGTAYTHVPMTGTGMWNVTMDMQWGDPSPSWSNGGPRILNSSNGTIVQAYGIGRYSPRYLAKISYSAYSPSLLAIVGWAQVGFLIDLSDNTTDVSYGSVTSTGNAFLDNSIPDAIQMTKAYATYTHYFYYDNIIAKKTTANPPTATVTDEGTYYSVVITNNEATELTNYPVAIAGTDLGGVNTSSSLKITDAAIPFNDDFHYWIEDNDRTWINVSSIPVGTTTLKVEKKAGYAPNGSAVWYFYDNFTVSNPFSTGTLVGTTLKLTRDQATASPYAWVAGNYSWTNKGFRFITKSHRYSSDTYSRNGYGFAGGWTGTEYLDWFRVYQSSYNNYIALTRFHPWGTSLLADTDAYSFTQSTSFETWETDYYGNETLNYETYRAGTKVAEFKPAGDTGPNYNLDMDRMYLYTHGNYGTSYMTYDWVAVGQLVNNSPTITVTDKTTYYEVNITNTGEELTNYPILVAGADLGGVTESTSLYIYTGTPPVSTIPEINQTTYNHSTAIDSGNETVWRTNIANPSYTLDLTPTIRFDTDLNANCRMSTTDSNYTTMNSSMDCSTTGTTSHVCTLYSDTLLSPGTNYLYVGCAATLDSTQETATSTSGALNLTIMSSCDITSTQTISTNLDCSGETFAISGSSVVTIPSGVTVTALNTTIESGSSIVRAGILYNGVS